MIKLLMISSMLLLLNAAPLPTTNALSSNSQQLSRALPRPQRSVTLGQLEHGFQLDGISMRFPEEIQLKIFENLSMSFKDAKQIASDKHISIDWAFQHFDPSKKNYAILRKWEKISDPKAKKKLRKKMMLNPKLKNILTWKGGLDLTYGNLLQAIKKGNLDIVEYFIASGFEPWLIHLMAAIRSDKLDILRLLIKESKINIDLNMIIEAIRSGNPDIVKSLINDGNFNPTRAKFNFDSNLIITVIQSGNPDITRVLINDGNFTPNEETINDAIFWTVALVENRKLDILRVLVTEGNFTPNEEMINYAISSTASKNINPDILRVLINDGNFTPTEKNMNKAIQWTATENRNLDIVKFLVNEGKFSPTKENLIDAIYWDQLAIVRYFVEEAGVIPGRLHMKKARQVGNPEIIQYFKERLPFT